MKKLFFVHFCIGIFFIANIFAAEKPTIHTFHPMSFSLTARLVGTTASVLLHNDSSEEAMYLLNSQIKPGDLMVILDYRFDGQYLPNRPRSEIITLSSNPELLLLNGTSGEIKGFWGSPSNISIILKYLSIHLIRRYPKFRAEIERNSVLLISEANNLALRGMLDLKRLNPKSLVVIGEELGYVMRPDLTLPSQIKIVDLKSAQPLARYFTDLSARLELRCVLLSEDNSSSKNTQIDLSSIRSLELLLPPEVKIISINPITPEIDLTNVVYYFPSYSAQLINQVRKCVTNSE